MFGKLVAIRLPCSCDGLVMPESSELARLRAVVNRSPVIYLTARDAVEDRVRGLELGADDYLVKPFSPIELQARIQRLLR